VKSILNKLTNISSITKAFLLLLIFFSLEILPENKYELLDRVIAVIEKDVITLSELQKEEEKVIQNFVQQKRPIYSPADVKKEAMDNLIQKKIIIQYAEQQRIVTSPEEIEFFINNILERNNIKLEDLENDLNKSNSSLNDFKNELDYNLTLKKVKQREIMPYVNISDYEVDAWIKDQEKIFQDEYLILHILLKNISEKDKKVGEIIAEAQLNGFREAAIKYSDGPNADNGGDLGWNTTDTLPVLFAENVVGMKEGELQTFTSDNGTHIIKIEKIKSSSPTEKRFISEYKFQQILLKKNNFVSDEILKEKIDGHKNLILNGMDFNDAIKKYSDDTIFKDDKELEWVNVENLLPAFREQFTQYPKENILGPFKTELGWHLVKILDFRESDVTDQSIRDSAKLQIANAKTELRFRDWFQNLLESSNVRYVED